MKSLKRKAIPDYPDYFADREGLIWRKLYGSWRVINPVTHHDGYQYTYVGIQKRVLTQRLVCAAFKGMCPEDMQICIRRAKNQQPRRLRSQRYLKWGKYTDKRKRKNYTRLSESDQKQILRLYKEGKTQIDIARRFGVTQPAISYLIKRKTRSVV
jgi:DNA-binding NarL/FixJ family response regulator